MVMVLFLAGGGIALAFWKQIGSHDWNANRGLWFSNEFEAQVQQRTLRIGVIMIGAGFAPLFYGVDMSSLRWLVVGLLLLIEAQAILMAFAGFSSRFLLSKPARILLWPITHGMQSDQVEHDRFLLKLYGSSALLTGTTLLTTVIMSRERA